MLIKGKTQTVGIFGFPVEHSFSPSMHNAAFEKLGLDFVYLPFCVRPDDLPAAVKAIKALSITGVNITVPHKQNVLGFLDKVDSVAEMIGAVNTIHCQQGELVGYNTDGTGFINSLKEEGQFIPLGKTAFLIGAGGAGHALALMLAEEGIKKLYLTDIIREKSQVLFNRIKKYFNSCTVEIVDFKEECFSEKIAEVDILLNATPTGMHEGDSSVIKENNLRKDLFVYDVVYNRETALLKSAKQKGAKTLGGLGMLLNQGALAFKIWTGKEAPKELMKEVLQKQINNR